MRIFIFSSMVTIAAIVGFGVVKLANISDAVAGINDIVAATNRDMSEQTARFAPIDGDTSANMVLEAKR